MSGISACGGYSAAMYPGLQSSRETQAQRSQQLFDKLDVDGDGAIDSGELESLVDFIGQQSGTTGVDADALLTSLDTDGDGGISSAELADNGQTLFDQLREQLSGAQQASRPAPPDPEEMFAEIDTDGDGSISEDEFQSAMQRGPGGPPPPEGDDPGRLLASLLEQYGVLAGGETGAGSSLEVAA